MNWENRCEEIILCRCYRNCKDINNKIYLILKNKLILLEILYILELEVNVCRLLMVRGINNSVRKCSHLLYRWDRNSIACKCSPSANVDGDFYHERKVIYGDTAGIFLSYKG